MICLAIATLAEVAGQVSAGARTLDAVLQDLRDLGIDVIYSSELVPPELTAQVADELQPLARAEAALGVHGLRLRQLGPKTYVVVRLASPVVTPVNTDEPLQEISVYASRYSVEGRSIGGVQKLDSTDIQSVPGSHDDALRALHVLPGIAGNVSARPYIRGSLSEDVLVRYDGITLLDPFHFKNFQSLISAIDPSAIDRIEVFSGGFPVRYGTRSGGVIDMAAPSMASGAEYRASASLMSASLSTIGHSETMPMEWLGSIRRSTVDMIEALTEEFGRPQFADSLGRLRWRTEQGAWTAGWLLLDDRLRLGGVDDEEQATARYRDEYLWVARDHRFSDALQMRATVTTASAERTRSGTLVSPGVAVGNVAERRSFNGFELTNDWTFQPNERSSYSFGGAVGVMHATSSYSRQQQFSSALSAAFGRPEVDGIDVRIRPEVYTGALHVAKRHRWANFEAELGLRVDAQQFDPGGFHSQFSPRLNLRYDRSDRTRWYASVGRFTQAQRVEEWRIEEAQATADSAQVSIHSILGYEHQWNSGMRLGIEAYGKRWTTAAPYFDNSLDPLSLLPDLAPDRVRIDPQQSEASGLEISLRRPITERLSSFGTLTWSRVADDIPPGDVLRSWDQPLALTTGLSWQGTRASLSAIAGWHRGWPRTPFRWSDADAGLPQSLQLGSRSSARWGDFFSLDMRGAWTWTLARGDLAAVLEITNSTNQQNECCAVFSLDPGDTMVEQEITHWLPFVFNLGVTWRWHNR